MNWPRRGTWATSGAVGPGFKVKVGHIGDLLSTNAEEWCVRRSRRLSASSCLRRRSWWEKHWIYNYVTQIEQKRTKINKLRKRGAPDEPRDTRVSSARKVGTGAPPADLELFPETRANTPWHAPQWLKIAQKNAQLTHSLAQVKKSESLGDSPRETSNFVPAEKW